MTITYSDMAKAIQEAENVQARADMYANRMAKYLAKRLRSSRINTSFLDDFKKELRNYNMTTGTWKDK